MDLYLLLKFLHVAMAIVWVGGASILTLLLVILMKRGDDQASLTAMSYMGLLGNRVFAPVGGVTILSGLVLAWLGGWFPMAWTLLAPAIVACTFVLGATVLGPTGERIVKLWQAGDTAGAMTASRKLMRLVALDLGAQWAIIALMVMKPGWTDAALAVPAALILAGLAVALRRPVAPQTQAA